MLHDLGLTLTYHSHSPLPQPLPGSCSLLILCSTLGITTFFVSEADQFHFATTRHGRKALAGLLASTVIRYCPSVPLAACSTSNTRQSGGAQDPRPHKQCASLYLGHDSVTNSALVDALCFQHCRSCSTCREGRTCCSARAVIRSLCSYQES